MEGEFVYKERKPDCNNIDKCINYIAFKNIDTDDNLYSLLFLKSSISLQFTPTGNINIGNTTFWEVTILVKSIFIR